MSREVVREGPRTWGADSATRGGLRHRIDLALDGTLLCNCEAGQFRRNECWAVKAVREELEMTQQSTALVPVQVKPVTSLLPTERDLALIDKASRLVFAGAISLPRELNTHEKVGAVMLYGLELGLAPMTAIRHLYIVNGKVSPSAEVMIGLLMSRHPDVRLHVVELTNDRCTLRLVWPSRDVDDTYTVTWDDIKRAKLDKDVAVLYPQDRLRWHCTKRLLRIFAPDVINGMDQGAPVLESLPRPAADDDDDRDLYNEGDQEYIDGQYIDRGTGEILEPFDEHGDPQETHVSEDTSEPPVAASSPAAPPDIDLPAARQRLAKRVQEVKASIGRDWNAVNVQLHSEFPNVWEGDTLAAPRLDAETIARMDAVLRRAMGEPEEPPV